MSSDEELVQTGKKFLTEGKFADALDCFEQSLLSDPTNPNLLNLKGAALRSLGRYDDCLLYTSPSPRDGLLSRMPSSA